MTPCWFCGEDSGDGYVGHVSTKPDETGVFPYCGNCEPQTADTIAVMSPQTLEAILDEIKKRREKADAKN